MENSHLGGLPAELRNIIFSMALTDPNGLDTTEVSWGAAFRDLVNFSAVCKQIRQETKGVFFHENVIVFSEGNWSGCLAKLDQIPTSLSPQKLRLRFEMLEILHPTLDTGYDNPRKPLAKCRKAIEVLGKRFNLEATIMISFQHHRWAGRTKDGQGPVICKRDVPLTENDCGRLDVVFHVGESAEAHERRLDNAHQTKKASIAAHAEHRLCPIRAEQRALQQSLETAVDCIRDVISEIP